MLEFQRNLDFISEWLRNNQPNSYDALQPGLDRSEIDYFLEPVPFLLPEEFYQLYQWRDGTLFLDDTSRLFPGYRFNSIRDALDLRLEISEIVEDWLLDKMRNEDGFWIEHSGVYNNYFLPIFSLDHEDHICILGKENKDEISPILSVFFEGGVHIKYDNLNSMMKTIAVCYEIGAYYNFEHPDGHKELYYDENLVEEIRAQYNPGSDFVS